MSEKKDVRNATVVGAGIMGRGIAHVAAVAGFTTVLHDVSGDVLETSFELIRRDLEKGVEIGKLSRASMEEALSRLSLQTNLDRAVAQADLIIEAIPEKIELKLDVFARLDRLCAPDAILATNTSALSITEMAGATKRPQQV